MNQVFPSTMLVGIGCVSGWVFLKIYSTIPGKSQSCRWASVTLGQENLGIFRRGSNVNLPGENSCLSNLRI